MNRAGPLAKRGMFHIDPTLIRLIWAIGTLSTMGSGILAYILAAVILPEEPASSGSASEKGE